jgi:two-component system response regulator PrrA
MPSQHPRELLIVEDDAAVRDGLERGLRMHGYTVDAVPDAERALEKVATRRPDMLVVDVGLPGLSGIELCERLREFGVDVPILILSARDQIGDRVAGLQAGADDYVIKPFALDELVARVEALLRRAGQPRTATANTLAGGPLWMDLDRRTAAVDGTHLELSRREFDLLAAFLANQRIVLSRIRILELVWGYDFEVDTNVVDVFVGYLRRKLAATGAPDLIATVRGVGFVLRAE